MPIPLLFIAAGIGTGLLGIGKSIKAGVDQKEASETNNAADSKIKHAAEKANESRQNCDNAIKDLGKKKVEILNSSINTFVTEYKKIKNLKNKKANLDDGKMKIDQKEFEELQELQKIAASLAGGVTSGAMAGALTAFGAYGVAGVFASASTGTAIASLSGAAATNATLAFFGGGSLAAGGLGMAGGTAVLGGLVAGPALAVLGFVVGAKASKNLDTANANWAKAKEYEEEMKTVADLSNGIRRRAALFERILIQLQTVFDPLVYEMTRIVEESGTDANKYSAYEVGCIAQAQTMAVTIKTVLNTSVIDKDGNLTKASEEIAQKYLTKS